MKAKFLFTCYTSLFGAILGPYCTLYVHRFIGSNKRWRQNKSSSYNQVNKRLTTAMDNLQRVLLLLFSLANSKHGYSSEFTEKVTITFVWMTSNKTTNWLTLCDPNTEFYSSSKLTLTDKKSSQFFFFHFIL